MSGNTDTMFTSTEAASIREARLKAASMTEKVSSKFDSLSWERCERCNRDYEPKRNGTDQGLCKACW